MVVDSNMVLVKSDDVIMRVNFKFVGGVDINGINIFKQDSC